MTQATEQPQGPATGPQPLPPSSLVICTLNRPQMLSETVASILEANETPSEIVIIDQSSGDCPSLEGLPNSRGCQVRHIFLDEIGSSRARNAGVKAARYDVLAFIDDDMWVDPGWYRALIQALVQGGPRAVVTGKVAAAPSEKQGQFVIATHTWEEPAVYQGRIGKDVLASGDMALYRPAYEAAGGLDERLGPGTRFPGAEDNDFGYRLLEAGYCILYVPGSVIYHRAWRNREDYVPLFWKYGRGQGAFYAKHWSWRDRYMLSRARKDWGRFFRLLPQRLWDRQLLVLSGSTAFLLGECLGALEWTLTQQRGPR